MSKRTYDSTVARIAGNILSGAVRSELLEKVGSRTGTTGLRCHEIDMVMGAVRLARAVVNATILTEPKPHALEASSEDDSRSFGTHIAEAVAVLKPDTP